METPYFGPDDENLIDMLRSPAVAVPHSLSGQLEYIRERWGHLLGHHLYRLLRGLDLIREEEKAAFRIPYPAQWVAAIKSNLLEKKAAAPKKPRDTA